MSIAPAVAWLLLWEIILELVFGSVADGIKQNLGAVGDFLAWRGSTVIISVVLVGLGAIGVAYWDLIRGHVLSTLPRDWPQSTDRKREIEGKGFVLKADKWRGEKKPNGQHDIYSVITVTNKRRGTLRGCRARLLRARTLRATPDGTEYQLIDHIHPANLQWGTGIGRGVSQDIETDATFDVAAIEDWERPVFQLLTAELALRSSYNLPRSGLEASNLGEVYILVIEVTTENRGTLEWPFQLEVWNRNGGKVQEPQIVFNPYFAPSDDEIKSL